MKKTLRNTVLVDCGKAIDQLGSNLIITPDKYKRMDNIGTIVLVGPKCVLLTKDDVGKKVITGIYGRDDCRFSPKASKEMALKEHWHIRVPEDYIEALLE